MKRVGVLLLAFALTVLSVSAFSQVKPSQEGAPALPHTDRLPGVDLAEGISLVTGTAVSPLLGVTAFGAWRYFKTPESQRSQLPWFTKPYIWGIGCLLLALCLLKDVVGPAVPVFVKKPLDAMDALEDKLSAALACGGFVPFVAAEMARHAPDVAFDDSSVQMASMLAGGMLDMRLLIMPAAMIGFAVVWLACHAINVLVLLSPFGLVDGLFKTFKLVLLASIAVSAAIAPWLGAALSLLMIYVAWLLAPWAFRLTVFGAVLSLDVLFPWHGRRSAQPDQPRAFLAKQIEGVPIRTYGRLERSANGIGFRYRPWLILSERSVMLPKGRMAIAKGLLYPSLVSPIDNGKYASVLLFRPCYRSYVHAVASNFGGLEVRESSMVRGFRAIRAWVVDTVSPSRWRRGLKGAT